MATYRLKYYAEFRNTREQDFRLSIFQRSYTGSSKKIAYLAGCVLELQGNLSSVISPIVKTQLRFTVVDASDISDTSSTKYGNWQEFYTPDSTLYKVTIARIIGSNTRIFWTGYITPDSWQESLAFRGEITITARDNIGHLQDFQFDAVGNQDGLIKIIDLVDAAMAKIDFPMTYSLQSGPSVKFLHANDVELHEAFVNVSLFENMDWYQVLERTLEAIGYVFRFVDSNNFILTPLRNITRPDVGGILNTQAVEFYGGTLELDPAVKQIEEYIDYGNETDIELDVRSGIQYGTEYSYLCLIEGGGSGWSQNYGAYNMPYNKLTQSGCAISAASDSLDPDKYPASASLQRQEGDSWQDFIMFPVNYAVDPLEQHPPAPPSFYFTKKVHDTRFVLRLKFADPLTTINDVFVKLGMSLAEIKYAISYSTDGTAANTRWWDGQEWVENTGATPITVTQTFEWRKQFTRELLFNLTSNEAIGFDGTLTLAIYDMQYKVVQYVSATPKGVYARIQSLKIETGTSGAQLKSDKVTTINNAAYNVKINRKPLFGALSQGVRFILPGNYVNAMFYYPGANPQRYPYLVHFTGTSDTTEVPLPVAIHQQILCFYYGASRALNGNCAPINKALFYFNRVCTYKGHSYLLQGGVLDLFSGIVTGAILREFVEFSTLWSGGAPEYNEDVTYND